MWSRLLLVLRCALLVFLFLSVALPTIAQETQNETQSYSELINTLDNNLAVRDQLIAQLMMRSQKREQHIESLESSLSKASESEKRLESSLTQALNRSQRLAGSLDATMQRLGGSQQSLERTERAYSNYASTAIETIKETRRQRDREARRAQILKWTALVGGPLFGIAGLAVGLAF